MAVKETDRPLRLFLAMAVIAATLLATSIYFCGWGRDVPTPEFLVT